MSWVSATIGGAVAQIGNAFGMKVIAWSQNLTTERAAEVGATLVSKDELFREADIVSIHLVLSGRTRGLVGAAELALMKPTARLVNTSRGPIVVEADLVAALTTKRSPAPPSMSSTRSRCRSTIRSARCRTCWRRRISATSRAACTSASTRTRSRTSAVGSTAWLRDHALRAWQGEDAPSARGIAELGQATSVSRETVNDSTPQTGPHGQHCSSPLISGREAKLLGSTEMLLDSRSDIVGVPQIGELGKQIDVGPDLVPGHLPVCEDCQEGVGGIVGQRPAIAREGRRARGVIR